MKKTNVPKLPGISADKIANNLKRGVGRDKAWKIADGLAKELSRIKADDFDDNFFTLKDLRKGERIWTQVRNILAK